MNEKLAEMERKLTRTQNDLSTMIENVIALKEDHERTKVRLKYLEGGRE